MPSILSLSLILSSLVISALAGAKYPYNRYIPRHRRTCGTNGPDDSLRSQHIYLHANEPLENQWMNSSLIKLRTTESTSSNPLIPRAITDIYDYENPYTHDKRQTPTPLYTVETYFHIVADQSNASPGSAGYVTDQMITDQLTYLNNAYAGSGIAYSLQAVTRTVNDTWARNGDDVAMKTALRRGTYSTLNVYYQTLLQSNGENGIPVGSILLGYCSLPTSGKTPSTPMSNYIIDGCNILSGTLPGSFETGYNLGGTTVHEVGHWNGLLHPFQDNSCSPDDFGDYVADTPQESVATLGCPTSKDSCPNSGIVEGSYDGTNQNRNNITAQGYSGPDPIHNFMDYSADACYRGFTPGQGARMVNLWVVLRMGL